jgi:ribosomal protein L37E
LQEGVAELNCEKCGSDLLKPQGGVGNEIILECISCGSLQGPDEYASRAIHSALSGEAYRTAKDGGESPYAICPECGQEAYVMDEDQCAACGESVQRECSRCGEAIPAEELDSSPFCGYCAHMISKND